MFNRKKMRFSLPSAACRTIANKRFVLITGNFVITATTKEIIEKIENNLSSKSRKAFRFDSLAHVLHVKSFDVPKRSLKT